MEAGDNDLKRLARVCAAYGLGEPRAARYLPIGVINRNWRVDTTTGAYAVKELRDSNATGVREQHRRVKLLIGRGVPIPQPLERAGGDAVCAVDGAEFTVSVWAPGEHLGGTTMSLAQAAALGDLLGRIHVALTDVAGTGTPGPGIAVPDPGQALSYLDHLLDIIGRKPVKDDIDEVALANLAFRREILTDPALSAPATEELGPQGYIHGDFHHNNVLWHEGEVSAVVDWDRIRVHSLASELIRTCLLTFGGDGDIDLPRTAEFVRGYRRWRPLTGHEIADAEARMWWLWLNGFWPLDQRYEHGVTTFDHLYVRNASTFTWWTKNRSEVVAALTGGHHQ
ncbi:MAG TPA: phosphotransferase [Candidatus Limnocylindrales bacterium]|nr:phosphotransferase [Candidatus Limnocylindrales bacterium]